MFLIPCWCRRSSRADLTWAESARTHPGLKQTVDGLSPHAARAAFVAYSAFSASVSFFQEAPSSFMTCMGHPRLAASREHPSGVQKALLASLLGILSASACHLQHCLSGSCCCKAPVLMTFMVAMPFDSGLYLRSFCKARGERGPHPFGEHAGLSVRIKVLPHIYVVGAAGLLLLHSPLSLGPELFHLRLQPVTTQRKTQGSTRQSGWTLLPE